MKNFLVIHLITFIIVVSVFTIDRYIPDEPKSKFGKWWRKHIIEIEK